MIRSVLRWTQAVSWSWVAVNSFTPGPAPSLTGKEAAVPVVCSLSPGGPYLPEVRQSTDNRPTMWLSQSGNNFGRDHSQVQGWLAADARYSSPLVKVLERVDKSRMRGWELQNDTPAVVLCWTASWRDFKIRDFIYSGIFSLSPKHETTRCFYCVAPTQNLPWPSITNLNIMPIYSVRNLEKGHILLLYLSLALALLQFNEDIS